MHHSEFKFYGNLNDFLRPKLKNTPITYAFNYAPALKDAIEAIGVPHVEVAEISVGGVPHPAGSRMKAGSTIEVFPFAEKLPAPNGFVLDGHLGQLAKNMRMLGLDANYSNEFTNKQIAAIAFNQKRVVLTRNIQLLKYSSIQQGYWLRSQNAEVQLLEILNRFCQPRTLQPFTRCLVCNGLLAPVLKSAVAGALPTNTARFFDEFFVCEECNKIYWKGSHYDHMLQTIKKFRRS